MVAAVTVNMPRALEAYAMLIEEGAPFPPDLHAADGPDRLTPVSAGFPAPGEPTHSPRTVGGLVDAGGRVGGCSQGVIGPVQLVHLRRRPPGQVVLAGLGQQLDAGVIEATSKEKAAARSVIRARHQGRRRPATSPSAASKPSAAARKSPSAQARSACTNRSRCRKLSGASPARAANQPVTSSSSDNSALRWSRSLAQACPARANPRSRRARADG
jgi:hypothetical protein